MPGPLPLDEQLCFSLYAATIAINRVYKPVLDRLGITYPQFLVLQVLNGAEDGVPIGAIADRLGLEPSTITPAKATITRVRTKVATSACTPATPTLARIAVSAAKPTVGSGQKRQDCTRWLMRSSRRRP